MQTRHLVSLVVVVFLLGALATVFWRNNRTDEQPSPKFALLYNAEEHPEEKQILAQILQAQLKSAGIAITLDPVPSTVYNDRISKGQFQAALTLWYLDYNDAEGFLTDFYSKAGYRLSKYNSSAYDHAYLSALSASTDAEKYQDYRKAEAILASDMPWIPILSNDEVFLTQPGASGFRSNAFQYYDYRTVELSQVFAATDVEVQTLDPAQAYDLASKHLVTQSYEGLIAMNEKGSIVPALAKSWSFSGDHRVLTFNLRSGVTFQGCPFFRGGSAHGVSSADAKASFERLVKANSPYSYIFDHVEGIESFKSGKSNDVSGFVARGPLVFEIHLKTAFPTMLPWLLAPAGDVLPAGLPQNYNFAGGSCGTGPFTLTRWNGAEATFTANPVYWQTINGRSLPFARSLSIKVIKDAAVQLAAFQRGELSVLNVPLPLFHTLFNNDGSLKSAWKRFNFREVQLDNLQFIAFNMNANGPTNSAAFRQQVSRAIDSNAIVIGPYMGKARKATAIIPTGMAGFERVP